MYSFLRQTSALDKNDKNAQFFIAILGQDYKFYLSKVWDVVVSNKYLYNPQGNGFGNGFCTDVLKTWVHFKYVKL